MRVIAAALVTAAAAVVDIIGCIYAGRTAGGGFIGRAFITASAGFIAGCRGARYRSRTGCTRTPAVAAACIILSAITLMLAGTANVRYA